MYHERVDQRRVERDKKKLKQDSNTSIIKMEHVHLDIEAGNRTGEEREKNGRRTQKVAL